MRNLRTRQREHEFRSFRLFRVQKILFRFQQKKSVSTTIMDKKKNIFALSNIFLEKKEFIVNFSTYLCAVTQRLLCKPIEKPLFGALLFDTFMNTKQAHTRPRAFWSLSRTRFGLSLHAPEPTKAGSFYPSLFPIDKPADGAHIAAPRT